MIVALAAPNNVSQGHISVQNVTVIDALKRCHG
jgi:hypothetical protein